MSSNTLEAELIDLEKKYWRAIKDQDLDTLSDLTDFPVVVTGAQGVGVIDKPTFDSMVKASNWTLNEYELDEPVVRLINDDVAVLAYKVREIMTVDGEPVAIGAVNTSTWMRRNGNWVCALHTESISGDPFGRDRKLAD
jgi:Domain of unknown function (DUF4440)